MRKANPPGLSKTHLDLFQQLIRYEEEVWILEIKKSKPPGNRSYDDDIEQLKQSQNDLAVQDKEFEKIRSVFETKMKQIFPVQAEREEKVSELTRKIEEIITQASADPDTYEQVVRRRIDVLGRVDFAKNLATVQGDLGKV